MTAYTNIIPGPREMCILICHQAKKESEVIKTFNIVRDTSKGYHKLLKEMEKTFGKKKKGQFIPDNLEGDTEKDEIIKRFKEVY